MSVSTTTALNTSEIEREIRAVGMSDRQFADYIRVPKSELARVLGGGPASPELVYRILRGLADARRER